MSTHADGAISSVSHASSGSSWGSSTGGGAVSGASDGGPSGARPAPSEPTRSDGAPGCRGPNTNDVSGDDREKWRTPSRPWVGPGTSSKRGASRHGTPGSKRSSRSRGGLVGGASSEGLERVSGASDS